MEFPPRSRRVPVPASGDGQRRAVCGMERTMSDTDDDDCPNTIAPKGWENGIQLTEEEADFLDAMMGRAPSIYQETQLTPLDCQASEFAWIKASVDMRTPRQWLANEVF